MIQCTSCDKEIPSGTDSIYLSHGIVEVSKKSGLPFHNGLENNAIHATVECYIKYLAIKTNTSPDQLTDTMVDLCREIIEPDLTVEITDHVKENLREELQEEVIDHLGRHCAVCQEELDTIHNVMEMDYPRIQPPVQGLPAPPPPLPLLIK